ncbi:MAG TPA: hypothetical protein VIO94_05275 [Phenylobacterium sp.]
MKLHLVFAAAAALASVSFVATAPAYAAEPVVAQLRTAVPAKTKVVAGGAVFLCEADKCVAQAPASRTLATAACKELAKEVGLIATYGDANKQLADDKLGACNTVAASGTMIAGR